LGSLSSIFVPPTRGLYLFNASFESPDGQQGFNVTYLITSIGGEPSELLPLGLELTAAGSALAILSMPFVPLGRKASPNRPARRTGRASNGKARTVSLIGWELFGSRRVYLALMVLLATMFSAGAYNDEVVLFNSPVGYSPKPADLLAPTLSPTTDWLVTFPVIVAACAYSFSYERDSRVMRSVLLNPLGSARLFGAKALSVFLMALVPTAGAIAATIFMFDPLLSVREPLVVWANLWLWLVIYVLQICVMLGFAILPAVIFKKAFYAFVIPIFGYFLVYSEGFGITGRLPSLVWLAAVQSLAGYEIYFFSLRGVLLSFAPSLAVALACFLAAFFVFERQERE
jgi:ABC-type transport system involved in multi-copper enzyme maturation permease subunit